MTRIDYRLKEYNRIWIYIALVFLTSGGAVTAALTIREYWYEPFQMPTSSIAMAPAIEPGDKIFVRKNLYAHDNPEAGEIVVFKNPDNRRFNFVMRVVANAGDRIAIQNGILMINGQPRPKRINLQKHSVVAAIQFSVTAK